MLCHQHFIEGDDSDPSNQRLQESSLSSEESDEDEEVGLSAMIKRSELDGKDEDLTPLEEFYLADIEQLVNADKLSKLNREEMEIRS